MLNSRRPGQSTSTHTSSALCSFFSSYRHGSSPLLSRRGSPSPPPKTYWYAVPGSLAWASALFYRLCMCSSVILPNPIPETQYLTCYPPMQLPHPHVSQPLVLPPRHEARLPRHHPPNVGRHRPPDLLQLPLPHPNPSNILHRNDHPRPPLLHHHLMATLQRSVRR